MRARYIATVASLGAAFLAAACGVVLGDLTERGAAPGGSDAQADSPPPDSSVTATDAGADGAVDAGADGDAACEAGALAATCAGKACGPATDSCGTPVTCPNTCAVGSACGSGGPNLCGPPSCVGTGDGVSNCGDAGTSTCCESAPVPGGTTSVAGSAVTVSSFRLDDYEVTVGRFRNFVSAAVAGSGYPPTATTGRHSHLAPGGLNSGEETGWNALDWNGYLPVTASDWNTNLGCGYGTWTSAPGPNEKKPLNCASWYEMYAFCIWDGGFLPTNAEWQLAASAGGTRTYPWKNGTQPAANADLGNWGCYYLGTGTCSGTVNISPVGGIPAGVGAYGQFDLGGNVNEWELDVPGAPPAACKYDCANIPTGVQTARSMRGGDFMHNFTLMMSNQTNVEGATGHFPYVGGRCARKP